MTLLAQNDTAPAARPNEGLLQKELRTRGGLAWPASLACTLAIAALAVLPGCSGKMEAARTTGSIDGADGGVTSDGGGETDGGETSGAVFSARLEGSTILVDVAPGHTVSGLTCQTTIALEKVVSPGHSEPLVDARKPQTLGYYLDGEFVGPDLGYGCDVVSCVPMSSPTRAGDAYEYVQTGTKAPPASTRYDSPDGPPAMVPVIETRAFHGTLRLTIPYSDDATCSVTKQAVLELDVPADGVCCPIGIEGCSNGEPLGGWAPTLAACSSDRVPFDALAVKRADPHGCPELVTQEGGCCGCPSGAAP